ncbi:hypothetical protein G7Y89_g9822 [Cudoniella acicularis]|uniref:Heterokaryon incompatibility domain-containing protein n=1 Tax=Cudoniella acicularis TaxID=354080 RepID=A0A8H4RHM1_9HELO|nr:hypothetical protein G7Y89_g9822 [Cudoniella acicularis]
MDSTKYNVYQVYDDLRISRSKSRQWDALLRILQRPWFERIWVVQEVALAYQVQVRYGDEAINWDILASGMKKLHHSQDFRLWLECFHGVQLRHVQHTSLYNITRMHRFRNRVQNQGGGSYFIWRREGSRVPLLSELLTGSFYLKATDPKNHIHGLMGICRDPVEGAIHLLFHAAGVGNRVRTTSIAPMLPSWVPGWTNSQKYERLYILGELKRIKEFKARGEVEPKIKIKGGRVLSLSGVCNDVIDELGPVLFNPTLPVGEWTTDEVFLLATKYGEFWTQLKDSTRTRDPYPHIAQDQSLREAFRRTTVTDKRWFGWDISSDEFYSLFPEWEEKLESFLVEPRATFSGGGEAVYRLLQSMDRVTEQVKSSCGGRQLFITKKGYIGLCPPYALQGDLISITPGIHVPLVLRQVDIDIKRKGKGPGKKYQLVGECYVHGLMNGEAMLLGVTDREMELI